MFCLIHVRMDYDYPLGLDLIKTFDTFEEAEQYKKSEIEKYDNSFLKFIEYNQNYVNSSDFDTDQQPKIPILFGVDRTKEISLTKLNLFNRHGLILNNYNPPSTYSTLCSGYCFILEVPNAG